MKEIIESGGKPKVYRYARIEDKQPVNMFCTKKQTACFTGHRPNDLYGYKDPKAYDAIIDILYREALRLYNDYGVRQFISGMAQGIDMCAFRAVAKLRTAVPNHDVYNTVYVAYEGQESVWPNYGIFGKTAFYDIIMDADRVFVVDRKTSPSDGYYAVAKSLEQRNKTMCMDSSFLIAWYNGKGHGGTLNCIRDAKNYGLTVINAYDPNA